MISGMVRNISFHSHQSKENHFLEGKELQGKTWGHISKNKTKYVCVKGKDVACM